MMMYNDASPLLQFSEHLQKGIILSSHHFLLCAKLGQYMVRSSPSIARSKKHILTHLLKMTWCDLGFTTLSFRDLYWSFIHILIQMQIQIQFAKSPLAIILSSHHFICAKLGQYMVRSSFSLKHISIHLLKMTWGDSGFATLSFRDLYFRDLYLYLYFYLVFVFANTFPLIFLRWPDVTLVLRPFLFETCIFEICICHLYIF